MTAGSNCPDEARINSLLAGEAGKQEQDEFAQHLESCATCRARLEAISGADELPAAVVEALAEGDFSPDLSQLMEWVKAEAEQATQNGASADASCGSFSLSFLAPSENPRHLGRLEEYEILEVIGRGGMGIVLKARDPKLERVVAVRVLNPDLGDSGAARSRFLREARSAAAVTHEHVVTTHAELTVRSWRFPQTRNGWPAAAAMRCESMRWRRKKWSPSFPPTGISSRTSLFAPGILIC